MIYIFLAQNYGDLEKEPDCSLELTSVWHIRFIHKNELILIFFKLPYIHLPKNKIDCEVSSCIWLISQNIKNTKWIHS